MVKQLLCPHEFESCDLSVCAMNHMLVAFIAVASVMQSASKHFRWLGCMSFLCPDVRRSQYIDEAGPLQLR